MRHGLSSRQSIQLGIVMLAVGVVLLINPAMSQVPTTNITSSGLNTTIQAINSTTTAIDGGTRPGSGQNLFHSFGQFSVGEGHTALFRNSDAGATSNIFGRVTGGSISNIFGTIDSATNFPTANLWLINPTGFLFGPKAALNVGGSVNISTADYLRMADGIKFNALPGPADALLSMAPVETFGFLERPTLSPTFGTITVSGSELAVSTSKSLTMVGGDIEITGQFNGGTQSTGGFLFAPSGQIQLASVASKGEAVIGTTSTGAPGLNMDGISELGSITLSKQAILSANGDPSGTVFIRGGNLRVDSADIFSRALGNLDGARSAVHIQVTGEARIENGSRIVAIAEGSGRGGDILIKSGILDIRTGGSVFTRTLSDGLSGSISLQVGTLLGSAGASVFSDSRSAAGNAGAAGHVMISGFNGSGSTATSVSLDNSSIGTAVVGGSMLSAPAHIGIIAHTIELTNNASLQSLTTGSTQAGDISLTSPGVITLTKGSQITSSTRLGIGNAGDLFIKAPSITLADSSLVSSSTRSIGNAGTILIDGTTVSVTKGAAINSGTFGLGNAGEVIVRAAESITVSGTDPLTESRSAIASAATRLDNYLGEIGAAGTVSITAPVITISDQGNIFTSNAIDSGKAGDIVLDGRQVAVLGGGQVQSSTKSSSPGGSVKIMAEESLTISDANSQGGVSRIATGTLAKGDAGQIVIRTSM